MSLNLNKIGKKEHSECSFFIDKEIKIFLKNAGFFKYKWK